MSGAEDARALLALAGSDLNALRGMSRLTPAEGEKYFSEAIFGFHAQQAAEKCLKAWIAFLGIRFPRTHDLMVLLETL